jgi:hypothetical protein
MKGERLLAAALLAGRAIWAAGTLPVPATGIYLGIWADPTLASNQEKAIEILEGPAPTGINRPFALHLHYYKWSDLSQELNNGVFQRDAQLLDDLTHGRIPVISKSGYVYYISPTQVNSHPSGSEAPSFFVFNGGPYVAANHANGSLLGPVNLYPGSTTSCKPGEAVVIYANGFGSTSVPLVSGSSTQTGTLPSLPLITIGGLTATVTFAGLNLTPGEFQFDVVIPAPLANGDQSIVANYNGFSTQTGALITIQN